MAIRHLPPGEDFSAKHFPREFGFGRSAEGAPHREAPPPHEEPDADDLARGGLANLHPHGTLLHGVEHTPQGIVHHYTHGGHTVHHHDGRVTHHIWDGGPVHMAHGGGVEHMHDSSEYAHRGTGFEHEPDTLPKEPVEEPDSFARGGVVIPKSASMRPAHISVPHADRAPRVRAERSPVEKPPRNPQMTTTPRGAMPGGEMGYGVEPSAEPDVAGSEQGIPQLRRGGRSWA